MRSYGILRGVAGFLQFLFCLGVLSVFKGFKAKALLENDGDQVAGTDINHRVILLGALNPVLA